MYQKSIALIGTTCKTYHPLINIPDARKATRSTEIVRWSGDLLRTDEMQVVEVADGELLLLAVNNSTDCRRHLFLGAGDLMCPLVDEIGRFLQGDARDEGLGPKHGSGTVLESTDLVVSKSPRGVSKAENTWRTCDTANFASKDSLIDMLDATGTDGLLVLHEIGCRRRHDSVLSILQKLSILMNRRHVMQASK